MVQLKPKLSPGTWFRAERARISWKLMPIASGASKVRTTVPSPMPGSRMSFSTLCSSHLIRTHVRTSRRCGNVIDVNVRNRFTGGAGVSADHESYKWWALSCTSLGMLLVATNSGTLIIALPDLERALGTSLLELVWVILAYMISSTVLVLTAGRLSDLFGRKTAFVGAFAIFGAASLGAGFAAD